MDLLEKEHLKLLQDLYNLEDDAKDFDEFRMDHSIEKATFLNSRGDGGFDATTDGEAASESEANPELQPNEEDGDNEPENELEGDDQSLDGFISKENAVSAQSLNSVDMSVSRQQSMAEQNNLASSSNDHFGVYDSDFYVQYDHKRVKLDQVIKVYPKPLAQTPKKKDRGYQLLATKLRIQQKPITKLLPKASKTLSTKEWRLALEEQRLLNMIDKIDSIKQEQRWTFKQLKKKVFSREKCCWDYVLDEMQWMSEDYRQERFLRTHICQLKSQMILEYFENKNRAEPMRSVQSVAKMILTDPSIIQDYTVEQQDEILSPEKGDTRILQNDPSLFQMQQDPEIAKSVKEVNSNPLKENDTINPALLISQPIFVNLAASTYYLPAGSQGLSYIPTFEFKFKPTILEEAIVPISKFMFHDYKYESPEESVKKLAGVEKYDNRKMNSLFQLDERNRDVLAAEEEGMEEGDSKIKDIKCPRGKKPESKKSSAAWTADEEDALFQLSQVYDHNWELISESLFGLRVGNSGQRTPWECYDHFITQIKNDFKPSSKTDYVYIGTQVNKKNKKVKVLGILGNFNYIINLTKKKPPKPAPKSNKQVNLTAHETHQKAQIQAGIDVNGPPLSSFELSRVKEQRDKLIEQSRQSMFMNQNRSVIMVNQMSFPVRPNPNFRPMRPQNIPIIQNRGFQGSPPVNPNQPMNMPNMNVGQMPTPQQMQSVPIQQAMQPGQMPPQMTPAQLQMLMQQSRPGPYTKEQLQMMMMAQQRFMAQRDARAKPRNQMQTDVSTAAAYVALQNAQNASLTKEKEPDPPAPAKVPKQQKLPPRRRSRVTVPISESEEDELENSDAEVELDEEEEDDDEISEVSSVQISKSTRSSTRNRNVRKRK